MNATVTSSLLSSAATTRLTIDLDAITENYRMLAVRADPGQTAAVVKADAYGLGMSAVAQRLWRAGCRFFFVATLEEALTLREILPEARIGLLGGLLQGSEVECVTAKIIPVLNDPAEIQRWLAASRAAQTSLPSILHVDTGMCRLGLSMDQARNLLVDTSRIETLNPLYLMSHLVSAEDPDHPITRTQLRRLRELHALRPELKISFANSSGMFLGRDFMGDLARPGYALYGGNPTPWQDNPMQPVVRLQAKILQIHDISADDTVGYNATWTATRPGKIATVAIGYADGFFRSASNRGHVAIGSLLMPVVGRVSMDLVTIDITDLPVDAVRPGDMVDVIGPNRPIDVVAKDADTIGYEVLTGLGNRLRRNYIGDISVD